MTPDAHGRPGTLEVHQIHPDLRLDEASLRRLAACVLEGERRAPLYVGIILADHETVRRLNARYRGDYVTDVLSFPLGDEGEIDGEVYVDLDTAAEQCGRYSASFEEEARRYVVHGLLHLLGYDDSETAAREVMRRREDHYLEACASGAAP